MAVATSRPYERHAGDTLDLLSVVLKRVPLAGGDPAAIDLTGLTVEVKMVNAQDDSVAVAQTATGVTSSGDATGIVTYDFSSPGADTPGRYRLYFVVISSGEESTFPVRGREVIIHGD